MIIDDRDSSRELAFLHPLNEMAVISRLECTGCAKHTERRAIGDVSMVGNGPDGLISVGVEVKQISDLLESEATGRLGDQLRALIDHYDERWLLTYGRFRSGPFNRLEFEKGERWRGFRIGKKEAPYSWMEGFLLTARVAGVAHKHVEDENQAAAWLAVLEKWWDKDWDEHKAFHKIHKNEAPGIIPDVSPDMFQRMRVAAELPGVGWERALAAAVSFPTVRSMINASEREWLDVPGIGPVLAKSIVRAVS